MAQIPNLYGVTTSLDLLRQGKGYDSLNHGLKRHQGQLDAVDTSTSLAIRADTKRLRLFPGDSIRASDICNAQK